MGAGVAAQIATLARALARSRDDAVGGERRGVQAQIAALVRLRERAARCKQDAGGQAGRENRTDTHDTSPLLDGWKRTGGMCSRPRPVANADRATQSCIR